MSVVIPAINTVANSNVSAPVTNPVLSSAAALIAEKDRLAKMEAEFHANRDNEIKNLPANLSFANAQELIDAIARVHNVKLEVKDTRKARVSLTPEQKASVIADFKAGMKAEEIQDKYGISVSTANNLKKEAGMVKARGEAPVAPTPENAPVVPALPPVVAPEAKAPVKSSRKGAAPVSAAAK